MGQDPASPAEDRAAPCSLVGNCLEWRARRCRGATPLGPQHESDLCRVPAGLFVLGALALLTLGRYPHFDISAAA